MSKTNTEDALIKVARTVAELAEALYYLHERVEALESMQYPRPTNAEDQPERNQDDEHS